MAHIEVPTEETIASSRMVLESLKKMAADERVEWIDPEIHSHNEYEKDKEASVAFTWNSVGNLCIYFTGTEINAIHLVGGMTTMVNTDIHKLNDVFYLYTRIANSQY